MRILSDKWKEKVNTGMDVQYIKYADITLKDGTVLNLTSADLWANGFSFEDSVSGDSSFDIGSTIINVLTLSINNFDGQYSDYDFDGAEVICYVGMEFDDGTTEKIRICTATVVEQPEDETVTIDLTCEDNIHKFDRNYSDSKLNYPATRGQIVRDACEVCGVTLQTLNFYRDDYIVQNRPNDEALTFRQILQWVAQIGCQWMRCDEYGRLCINWYGSVNEEKLTVDELGVLKTQDGSNVNLNFSNSDGVLSADNGTLLENDGILRLFATDEKGNISEIETTYGFTPHHTDVVITGVKVTEYSESSSDNPQTYMVGTEGYVLGISGNKLIRVGDGQTIASIIAEKCVGMRFRPFESECPTDVALEAGDSLIIVDRNGKIYTSLLTTTTLKPGSGQKIACNAKSAAKNSSTRYSQVTQAFVAARNMVKQEKTEREKVLEEFKNRLDNAKGVYTTIAKQEDGSNVFYLHDAPTLEKSQAVWKMTSEAWGVSTDGGQTWNGGMTVDGDTIVRILNAVGVNAKWINTGAITVKDSNGNLLFQVDMDTKKVYISGDCVLIGGKTASEALADNLKESKKYSDEVALKAQNMTLQLSNDIQTIATDADGNITDFPTVSTKATVMYGSSDITNDCSYTITKSDSITGSWNDATHIYNVTGLSADNGWIDIKATYLDNLSVTKRFTVSKVKAGAQGIPGRTYILEPSCNVLKRGSDKVISPNFLEFKAYYRDGNEAERHPYSGRFVVEETADGTTWNTIYTSSSDENTVKHYLYTILTDETGQTITDGNGTTIGIPRDITNIRCRLYQAGGTVNMYDMQSVAVVLDVDALTQTEIVKILTDDGKWNGLYYKNGRLYISFSAALGGELSLGGENNGNGILKNYDENGNLVLSLENRGLLYGDDLNNKELKFINPNKNGLRLSEWDGDILSYLDIGIYWYESDGYYVTEIMAESQIEFYLANGIDSKTNPYTPIVSDYYYTTIYNSFRCYKGEATLDELTSKSTKLLDVSQNTNAYNLLLMIDGTVTRSASSSKRYKDIGESIIPSEIEEWYKIEPVWAKYKDGYLAEGDENEGRYLPMFIAEDVEEHFPQAATHANNRIEDWNYRMMIPAMFAMIKQQKVEIDSLKQEIQEIKKLIRKE